MTGGTAFTPRGASAGWRCRPRRGAESAPYLCKGRAGIGRAANPFSAAGPTAAHRQMHPVPWSRGAFAAEYERNAARAPHLHEISGLGACRTCDERFVFNLKIRGGDGCANSQAPRSALRAGKIQFLRRFLSAQRYLAACWGGNLDRSDSFRRSDRFSNVRPTGC